MRYYKLVVEAVRVANAARTRVDVYCKCEDDTATTAQIEKSAIYQANFTNADKASVVDISIATEQEYNSGQIKMNYMAVIEN